MPQTTSQTRAGGPISDVSPGDAARQGFRASMWCRFLRRIGSGTPARASRAGS